LQRKRETEKVSMKGKPMRSGGSIAALKVREEERSHARGKKKAIKCRKRKKNLGKEKKVVEGHSGSKKDASARHTGQEEK